MAWKLTIRVRGRVSRQRHDELEPALLALEQEARAQAADSQRGAVDLRVRRIEPAQQVAARIELAGPERLLPGVRAGVDVRGDGSVEGYLGSVRRQVIEPRRRETIYDALRRAVQERLSPGRTTSSSRR